MVLLRHPYAGDSCAAWEACPIGARTPRASCRAALAARTRLHGRRFLPPCFSAVHGPWLLWVCDRRAQAICTQFAVAANPVDSLQNHRLATGRMLLRGSRVMVTHNSPASALACTPGALSG